MIIVACVRLLKEDVKEGESSMKKDEEEGKKKKKSMKKQKQKRGKKTCTVHIRLAVLINMKAADGFTSVRATRANFAKTGIPFSQRLNLLVIVGNPRQSLNNVAL